jgi:ketosteroid isomerase-like protein
MVVMTPRELMTDYLAAAKRGDWDTAFGFFAEDIVIHIPGARRSPAIDGGGMPRVGYIYGGARPLPRREHRARADRHACQRGTCAVLVRERFHGGGPPVEIRRANVYRVQGGLIVEVSIFEADQYLGRRGLELGRPSPTTANAADRLSSRRGNSAPRQRRITWSAVALSLDAESDPASMPRSRS